MCLVFAKNTFAKVQIILLKRVSPPPKNNVKKKKIVSDEETEAAIDDFRFQFYSLKSALFSNSTAPVYGTRYT